MYIKRSIDDPNTKGSIAALANTKGIMALANTMDTNNGFYNFASYGNERLFNHLRQPFIRSKN